MRHIKFCSFFALKKKRFSVRFAVYYMQYTTPPWTNFQAGRVQTPSDISIYGNMLTRYSQTPPFSFVRACPPLVSRRVFSNIRHRGCDMLSPAWYGVITHVIRYIVSVTGGVLCYRPRDTVSYHPCYTTHSARHRGCGMLSPVWHDILSPVLYGLQCPSQGVWYVFARVIRCLTTRVARYIVPSHGVCYVTTRVIRHIVRGDHI